MTLGKGNAHTVPLRLALLTSLGLIPLACGKSELMHLGAPRDLVVGSQLAMLDETAHAEACFALAARYLEGSVEPRRLPLDAALDERQLEPIVRLAFLEGCVGETVATLEAREALEGARDTEVRAALERIAADEQRHAELAWRFVRWALGQSDSVRALLERERALLERELEALLYGDGADAGHGPGSRAHGVLEEAQRRHVRRVALAEVVLPCARALLARPAPSAQAPAVHLA